MNEAILYMQILSYKSYLSNFFNLYKMVFMQDFYYWGSLKFFLHTQNGDSMYIQHFRTKQHIINFI